MAELSPTDYIKQLRMNASRNSKKFYDKKYKIYEGMDENHRIEVEKNIAERKLKLKNKYAENKEQQRRAQKEYRDRIKVRNEKEAEKLESAKIIKKAKELIQQHNHIISFN